MKNYMEERYKEFVRQNDERIARLKKDYGIEWGAKAEQVGLHEKIMSGFAPPITTQRRPM